MQKVTARIQEIPPDHRGGYALKTDRVETTAPTYQQALSAAEAQVPAGWRILWIMVDR